MSLLKNILGSSLTGTGTAKIIKTRCSQQINNEVKLQINQEICNKKRLIDMKIVIKIFS